MRPGPAVALWLTLLGLAGCAGGSGTAGVSGSEAVFNESDPGAIRVAGTTVDDELAPLEGVFLRLGDNLASTDSDLTGAFDMVVGAPGTYLLEAFKTGYDPATLEVAVPAQGLGDLQVVLLPTPEGVPYHETNTYVTFASCLAMGYPCLIANTILSNNAFTPEQADLAWYIPNAGLVDMVFEAVWDPQVTSTTNENFFLTRNVGGLLFTCGSPGNDGTPAEIYFQGTSPSPIRLWAEAQVVNEDVGGCANFTAEENHQYWTVNRYWGNGTTARTPLVLNHRVEYFLTFFYWRGAADREFTALPQE